MDEIFESGGKAMNGHLGIRWVPCVIFILALLLSSPGARAQNASGETPGVDSGNYNVQQTIEFGYRVNEINGNKDTYDTFINLGQGVRLLDYTFDMRTLNHQGLFFDDLNFSNFGYGGDPNDVTRLHIDKNKWYDFHLLFRRDKNFWDYNLWVNPFNPAALNPVGSQTSGCIVSPPTSAHPGLPGYCSNPAIAETNSPHGQDLVRRMQDYDVTLLPQSRVRFRLGFSHYRDEGPGFFSTDSGIVPDFPENYSYTTNAYRAGVDFRILPRTTISYDQFLNYFKQDNIVTDNPAVNPQNYGYVLANGTANGTPNGTPVDLGIVWSTQTPAEVLPCATPIVTGTVNTATPTCNGFLTYSQVGRPRNTIPSERLRFQSNYFKNFEMSGSVGYSTSDNKIPDFLEFVNDLTVRTATRGSTTGGPARAKRVSVNANWSGVYAVTDKFRILDYFRYDNWRIPGMWEVDETNIFGTGYPGIAGLQQNQAVFNAANCPAPFNAPTCPQHAAGSAADVINGYAQTFLGQNLKSNTFELEYDFSRRYSAHIGYLYTNRTIAQLNADTNGDTDTSGAACGGATCALTYYPGGAAGAPANDYLAARGSCSLTTNPTFAGCTLNPDGSVTFVGPAGAAPVRDLTTINENALLVGGMLRPIDALRITGDVEIGYNDASYTRIDPRQVQSYKVHVMYTPKPWATLDGGVEIHENRDNVYANSVLVGGVPTGGGPVINLEHDRSYGVSATLTPNSHIAVSFGYNYWDVYTQAEVCFNYSISYANPPPAAGNTIFGTSPPGVATVACPITGAGLGATGLGALSTYSSQDHFAHADLMWKPFKRATVTLGYSGSFVRGNTIFLNPLAPSGTLDYNYFTPYGSITVDIYKGFSTKMAWNYYGFSQQGNTSPFGLAAIPSQDFNGNDATFSFRYVF